jgi:hypothetical protein
MTDRIMEVIQNTKRKRIFKIRIQGFAINAFINLLWIAATIAAWVWSESIPLVTQSPSRYSVLIVPFLFGALVAATVSFGNYLSLRGSRKLLPIAGMFLAGYTSAILFEKFDSTQTAKLLDAYTERLDRIGLLILLFSVLTMVCSILKVAETRRVPAINRKEGAEKQPFYWALKILVGDLPIILSALVVIVMQHECVDCSHRNWANVYVSILNSGGSIITRGSDSFALLEIQRQLSVANFWIGVTLGVTGVQLVMQQVSSLTLDIAFWARNKLT